MPHRVIEPYTMNSSHRRHFDRRPSPPNAPPIATLSSNSPTPSVSSLDRSSVSTPPIRRSSPHIHSNSSYYSSHSQPYYNHAPPPLHHHGHHSHRGYDSHEGSPYSVPNTLPSPFMQHSINNVHPSPLGMGVQSVSGLNGVGTVGSLNGMSPTGREAYGLPIPIPYPHPGAAVGVPVIYTEDAATKLSDRVRRRCFNCCTTDTSTWRRSNLSPGKVLCNKCGLFERTHSRPRPDQFPHKRGPLAVSTLRSRSPPPQVQAPHTLPSPNMHGQHLSQHSPPQPPNTLPPISSPYSYHHPSHPSLAPLNSVASLNGSHNGSREESLKRPPSSGSWQGEQNSQSHQSHQSQSSPPLSRRSPAGNVNGRASPALPPLSSGSAGSTHSTRPKQERDVDDS